MAEVKKKFSELDPGSVPFEGTETLAAVQGGITKRATISGIHGAGWWDKLKAAFVDFVAPEALHANDADTIGGETSAELHNAGALTGTAPLSVIPAELTGKNAATSTYATNAGTSSACSGNAATATKLATARKINGVNFDGTKDIYDTYSTAEHRIGTWIDGKPIYRKVINFGTLPNNTTKNVAHGISNIDKTIKLYGIATSSSFTMTLPFIGDSQTRHVALSCSSGNINIKTYMDRTAYTAIVIIEYTKTTN